MDWFKIMCNILDHRKIKLIRKGPEGNTLVLLWLLMLAEAGKCNRGGYLMVTDDLPYSDETLSMVTDIPLATVQLALSVFEGLKMIDHHDGAIFILNWGRYQSEDKLEARRENDRKRKQLQRERERSKLLLPPSCDMSRDVTQEIRGDNIYKETTTEVRALVEHTPFNTISEQDILLLIKRHGKNQVLEASKIAATSWQKNQTKKIDNPGGYLQILCASTTAIGTVPPVSMNTIRKIEQRGGVKHNNDMTEQAKQEEINLIWSSFSQEQQEYYCKEAIATAPASINLPQEAVMAIAKTIAWEKRA